MEFYEIFGFFGGFFGKFWGNERVFSSFCTNIIS